MGRFVPIAVSTKAQKLAPKVTGAKSYYDACECWQYKVVYDRPGSYTFNVPSKVTCLRTVIVGGGGKPVCNAGCCGVGGAGGALSDKCMNVSPGTAIGIVVGRQSQDSSVSCNGIAVHTAGGATGCIPGTASGGDWNSRGGCAGYACNYCGGSVSHYCGACIYTTTFACCGYCMVVAYNPSDNGDTRSGCCIAEYPGGGSAGSPRHCCGGCSPIICGSGTVTHGSIATGGGGVGSQCWPWVWHFSCCNCACPNFDGNVGGNCQWWRAQVPTSASGGGGSHGSIPSKCRSWEGICQYHYWMGGDGGPGGTNVPRCDAAANHVHMYYQNRYNNSYGGCCFMSWVQFKPKERDPHVVPWWDICDISGAGAPGYVDSRDYWDCWRPSMFPAFTGRPNNSGEGAGTGGVAVRCCNACQLGDMFPYYPGGPADGVNWALVCCLGSIGDPYMCDAAYILKDKLFGGFLTCAGTLGGSGGVNICFMNSKAGAGGGGGTAKCHIVCVCWGGNYDYCNNNNANPLLAFPPCYLDNLIVNAGSGLAIIYYKED
jgi:hypothetical protein